MSKSLKNFITIDVRQRWLATSVLAEFALALQEILQRFTARQLRLAFLTQLWNAKVDFSESLMAGEVKGIETTFNVRLVCCGACQITNEQQPLELLHARQSPYHTSRYGEPTGQQK